MKKTLKIGLSGFAGLTSLGAVMPLITSCGINDNATHPHVTQDEEDIKYGIDANTYKNLVSEYRYKLSRELIDSGVIVGSDVWNEKMNDLDTALNSFDDIANNNAISYGQLTTGIRNYAKKVDNLNLVRTTNATWSQLDDVISGAIDSFNLYMDHLQFDSQKKAAVIVSAKAKFEGIKTQLSAEGYQLDPYGALLQAKRRIFSCFDAVNTQIAKMAACNALNDFIAKYHIDYKEDESSSRLQNLLDENKLPLDQDISFSINDIFEFIDEDGVSRPFVTDEMVPGYNICPILRAINKDPYTNTVVLDIDWTAVSNVYATTNDKAAATAHLYDDKVSPELEDIFNGKTPLTEDKFFDEVFDKMPIKLTKYSIADTAKKESTTIEELYFQEDGIKFRWPKGSDPVAKLDPFVGYITGQTTSNFANEFVLASAGLQIYDRDVGKWKQLSDVIASVSKKQRDFKSAHPNVREATQLDLTFAEKFVSNCSIVAEIKKESSTAISNEPTTIRTWINVIYKDTKNYKDAEGQEIYTLPESKQPGSCINYVLSAEFFKKLCCGFSTANAYCNSYTDLSSIKKTRAKFIVFTTALAVLDAACVGGITLGIIKLWGHFTVIDLYRSAKLVFGIVVCGIGVALATTSIAIISQKWLKPIDDYYHNAQKFLNTDEVKTVQTFVNKASKWFAQLDLKTSKPISTKEFDDKMVNFQQNMSVEEACDYEKAFSNWCKRNNNAESQTKIVKEFEAKSEQMHCSPQDWSKIKKTMSFKNPVLCGILAVSIGALACTILGLYLVIKNDYHQWSELDERILTQSVEKYGLKDGVQYTRLRNEWLNAENAVGAFRETGQIDWALEEELREVARAAEEAVMEFEKHLL